MQLHEELELLFRRLRHPSILLLAGKKSLRIDVLCRFLDNNYLNLNGEQLDGLDQTEQTESIF